MAAAYTASADHNAPSPTTWKEHGRKDSTETRVTKTEEIMQRGISRLYFQKRIVLFRK